MRDGEKIVGVMRTDEPIGCCGGNEYYLIACNNGYTTECACGMWCGQWYDDQESAINYFENMIKRARKRRV